MRVLSRLFRRLFLVGLAEAHAASRLAFFAELEGLGRREAFAAQRAPLRRKDWFVITDLVYPDLNARHGGVGRLFERGRSASPRQNYRRGRCCRRRSWPVRRPARWPRSSAIEETSIRGADNEPRPNPTIGVICTVKPAARPRGRSALGLRPHRHASRGRAPITPRRLRVLLPEVPARNANALGAQL